MEKELNRIYFALTNFCNRSCELCSCHSDPFKQTNLSFERLIKILEQYEQYEIQLEGGEPTIHPEFETIVNYTQNDIRCKKVILCTNAVTIPLIIENNLINENKSVLAIKKWLQQFLKKPFILKPSINSHLIKHSRLHMEKMKLINISFESMDFPLNSQLIYNVRRIPAPITLDSEQWIIDELHKYNLYEKCNDFLYQRYGKAKDEDILDLPYIVSNPMPFHLISPDGIDFHNDLIGRANHMENLK